MYSILRIIGQGLGTQTQASDSNGPGVYTVDDGSGGTDLIANVTSIINGVIGVLGVVCVVVMIVGGINYMTSGGESAKVKKGKDTILYGLIGLVICVLAFAIVNFVITNIISDGS